MFSRKLRQWRISGQIARNLVRSGLGIGYVDCFVGELEQDVERLPGFGLTEATLYAVTHVEMRCSPRVRAVLDFLTALVA